MKKEKGILRRSLAVSLAFVMTLSGMSIVPAGQTVKAADATDKIEISNASDLAKIGNNASYPMNGDYVLTQDIDLSGSSWTPIGGSGGTNYGLTSGERVFNGTFDGNGHVISGLTIEYNGAQGYSRNQSGLFAMIGSDSENDYAEVKNLVFTEVDIDHTLGGGDAIGVLSGEANGCVKIDNIAVLGGNIDIKTASGGDLLGVGGIVGQIRNGNATVFMENLYNKADITVESSVTTSPIRCGGIIGRIYQGTSIGRLSSCLNLGTMQYRGSSGYGINGYSKEVSDIANTGNITNCYYLSGSGIGYDESSEVTEAELKTETLKEKLGSDYWYLSASGEVMLLVTNGKVTIPLPSPTFADGDSASAVTQDFTLPLTYTGDDGEETISWVSSNPSVIAINGAQAVVQGVLADTQVILTATTSKSGKTKTVTVTVKSNLEIEFDKEYAKVGQLMRASVKNAPENTEFSYTWKKGNNVLSSTESYTPATAELNSFIQVEARLTASGTKVAEKTFYFSKLPVIYIDTKDGAAITSKENYKSATMRVQGNDRYNGTNSTLYEGEINIRGRGNSTWNLSYSKLPYRIKLGEKTDMFGFGTSKHWVLLANYLDESLLRNRVSYDLAGEMGLDYEKSASVDVVLNGSYAGNYQWSENIRVDKNRVDIFKWEDVPEDAAKAIAKKTGLTSDQRDELEEQMSENMDWITSGTVTYNGQTYRIEEYYTDLPKDDEGNVDVSGGYLFELDEYYDEVSKFKTTNSQPIMFKEPEFAATNNELFNAAKQYVQAVEDSITSGNYYVTYEQQDKHYTDLVDIDSLVDYLLINEFFWNTETMKKSTYMYKDIGDKLYIGPLWDMDWTSNSRISTNETNRPQEWMVINRSVNAQAYSWYKYLVADPYFVTQYYEHFQKYRELFENIVKENGVIDQEMEYLLESGNANHEAGFINYKNTTFTAEVERLQTFLEAHLSWMDEQFTNVDTLLTSLGKYTGSSAVSVTTDTSQEGKTVFTARIQNNSVKKAGFYLNGKLCGTVSVQNGSAVCEVADTLLVQEVGKLNTIQVRGLDNSGNLLSNGTITNYQNFTKEIKHDALTGTVTITGDAKVGAVLTAEVSDSNNSGTLSYTWLADDTEIAGANEKTYTLTENETGKSIKVKVTSSIETGSIVSAATEAVIQEEVKNDHLIILQVYGGGANDSTPVSHSFIEIYNPTENAVALSGYSVGYLSNGKSNTPQEVKLELSGSIPSHTSYLIRCEAQDTTTPELIKFTVSKYDQEWEQTIDNKRYQIILYNGTKVADAVSVNEGNLEGEALPDGTISKQKAIRRINFADTNNNKADFEVISYRDDADAAAKKYPRSLQDGAWESDTATTPTPDPDELQGTVSIRGNAIVGATLYADDAGIINNTGDLKYAWFVDNAKLSGEETAFLTLGKELLGKQISVQVSSSIETGSLTSEQTTKVIEKTAQREHLIIHQVYGGGGKGKTPISRSFIELYNPTKETIDLSGYILEYISGDTKDSYQLSGTMAPSSSYLIVGTEEETAAPNLVYEIIKADAVWEEMTISNKKYSLELKQNGIQIDCLAVNEESSEGNALADSESDSVISKNKVVRRISFIDTDNNTEDFEVLNYSKIPDTLLQMVRPRTADEGSWGLEVEDTPEQPTVQYYTVIFEVDGVETPVLVKEGDTVEAEEAPKKEGYTFLGWYLNDTKYDFSTPVNNELRLKAKWELIEQPDDPEPSEELVADVKTALSEADAKVEGDYTEESWKAFEEAKEAARKITEDKNATKADYEKALADLQAAVAALKKKELQTTPTTPANPDNGVLPSGTQQKVGKGIYKVLKADAKNGTVALVRPVSKTNKTYTVPATVKLNGIRYKVTEISKNAFKKNTKLTKVTIGKNVTKIGANAFSGAKSLKTVKITSKTLKSVGKNAFKGINKNAAVKVPKNKKAVYIKLLKKGKVASNKVK